MSDFEETVLHLAMHKVQAWERLSDYEYCGRLTMDGYKNLLLTAGYSEEVAQKTALQRSWDRLQAGVMI